MNDRCTGQFIISCVVVVLVAITMNAFAGDDVQRFDNGPFFSQADEFITASSSVLNKAENSPIRLSAVALVQRAVGGRDAHQRNLGARSLDELARYYIISVDGWTTTSAIQQFIHAFSQDANTKELASALRTSIHRFTDGSEIRAPVSQRISMFYGDMLVTGAALFKRGAPRHVAGEYIANVNGACAFDDGPVELVQDQFLLEGQRDDSLLFWGAVGDTRAYFATAENKYMKITAKRRSKRGQVEFPDKASELFSTSLDDPVVSLRGEFFGDCEIVLTPQSPVSGALTQDQPPTRLIQEPPEQTVERVDTPGVSLNMHEMTRSGSGHQLEVTYKFVAQGFPAELTYSFWRFRPQPEPLKFMENLTVDELGVMIVNNCGRADCEWTPAPLETAFPMTIDTIAPGEAFEFGILSDDMTVGAYATVYPTPLEKAEGDCRLVLERLNTGQTVYRAHVTGLTPGEALRIESASGGVVLHNSYQADADGRFSAYVFPEVLGKQYGQAHYRLYAGSCSLRIDYQWGVRPPKS